ncbi:MAG: META domain-containing protein [Bacteroidales bacterium]|nr:META domain-containing protein [Bacteroidales bacterium]
MTKKLLILAIAASLVLVFFGCKTTKKAAQGKTSSLVDTQWQLEALYGKPIDPGTAMAQPYIIFQEDGNTNGYLGCNIFFGTYYQKKQKLQMELTSASKKLCPQMDMERLFIKGMRENITSFSIKDSTLIIYADKAEIFRFKDSGKVLDE